MSKRADAEVLSVQRQGELLFFTVKLPQWVKDKMMTNKNLGNVIREGETTGHKHEIEGTATMVEMKDSNFWKDGKPGEWEECRLPAGQMFITTEDTITIKHPEHETLKLKGDVIVRIKTEYDEVRDRYIND